MRNLLAYGFCFLGTALAVQSNVKVKVYKDFFQEVMQNNMEAFFLRAGRKNLRDIELPSLRTKLEQAQISLRPIGGDYEMMDMQVFFENDNVLIEMINLEFSGDGTITDPNTQAKERVEFSGPLSVTKIQMKSGKQNSNNL